MPFLERMPLTLGPMESSLWCNLGWFHLSSGFFVFVLCCVVVVVVFRGMFACPCLCTHTQTTTVSVGSTFHEPVQTDKTVISLDTKSNDRSQAAKHTAEIKLPGCTQSCGSKTGLRAVCMRAFLTSPSTRGIMSVLFHMVLLSQGSPKGLLLCFMFATDRAG